jgi:hypothetical protein
VGLGGGENGMLALKLGTAGAACGLGPVIGGLVKAVEYGLFLRGCGPPDKGGEGCPYCSCWSRNEGL